ncbi:MAG: efflux RND transporter periplasmic adaptor subunit [Campylobacterota bacterium]|nr:efflux RND transporter periplasmic adaptor subunit [Campylobacterota bacterium]
MFKIITLSLLLTLQIAAGDLYITGTVVSDNQKMIGARYMGYVKHIYFNIGDKVHREDTLFEMESAEFDIMKNQADLALEQAEIMVDMYRTRMDSIRREKALLRVRGQDGSMDWNNLDISAENVQAGLAAARGLVENASTKVKQMATIANYLEVKAPNDGIIVQKRIRVGDLIVPGMLAMVLVDLDHLEIEGQISEADLLKVNEGDFVKVRIPSIKFKTRGRIKSVVPSANPMTHTFTIRVKFDQEGQKIYPGMYAKIDIEYNDNVIGASSH